MRLKKPNKKQIKIYYETQFSINLVLESEIEKKKSIKNDTKNNSSQFVKLIHDPINEKRIINLIESKLREVVKSNFQST